MNFVGHVEVARAVAGDRPDAAAVAFGAALPDLASMARLRIEPSALPPALREGVSLHHRTDGVFHSQEAFSVNVRELTARLLARGLATGPARAVGHAGFELLLDGCLLAEPAVGEAFVAVLEAAPDVVSALLPAEASSWHRLVGALRTDRWWLGYGDAALVATSLHRRLRSRRRLAFGDDEIDLVTEVLSAALPAVKDVSGDLFAHVVAAVRDEPAAP